MASKTKAVGGKTVVSLYFDLLSQPSRAVYMFLKMTGIPFTPKPLKLHKGEHKAPEILKLYPPGSVPFIVVKKTEKGATKEAVYGESYAIMKYLATEFDKGSDFFEREKSESVHKIVKYIINHDSSVRAPCLAVFLPLFMSREFEGGFGKAPLDEQKLKEDKTALIAALKKFCQGYLGTAFIGGAKIAAVDLLAYNELYQLKIIDTLDEVLKGLSEHEKTIKDWMERVKKTVNSKESVDRMDQLEKSFKSAKI